MNENGQTKNTYHMRALRIVNGRMNATISI